MTIEGGAGARRTSWALAAMSLLVLVAAMVVRGTGPTDLWDQTQPKTVSYTTDVIVHGDWVLPIERGTMPATKPPLYNWIAAPFVRVAGFASEIAHKAPSLLALLASWAMIVALGQRLDRGPVRCLGWVAGLAFVSNYAIMKLGYLARPDMVLTACLVAAWIAGTSLIIDAGTGRESRLTRGRAAVLWLALAAAWLTKGPAALATIPALALEARLVGGSWSAFHRTGWVWGVPLSIAPFLAWLGGAWLIDPEHVRTVLIFNEVVGRVTGLGPEGNELGPIGWLRDFPNLWFYYLVRFAPWSVPSIIAMVVLVIERRRRRAGIVVERDDEQRRWMVAGMTYVLAIIALFTLSTGKRSDYIVSAYAPGTLLAAWWLLDVHPRIGRRLAWLAPAIAIGVIATIGGIAADDPPSPRPDLSSHMRSFIAASTEAIHDAPAPVEVWNAGASHVQAMLGLSEPDGRDGVEARIRAGETFWVLGALGDDAGGVLVRHARRWNPDVRVRRVVAVPPLGDLARTEWPDELGLYRVEPASIGAP
ncbi:MAG: hypothetical protein KDA25_03010 [Phycisphaerales bacterium]|nr:hypothetical protein [Phycisphaerales bacterium]